MVAAYGGRFSTYGDDTKPVAMTNGSDDWTFRYSVIGSGTDY